jgi:hypothetical protein
MANDKKDRTKQPIKLFEGGYRAGKLYATIARLLDQLTEACQVIADNQLVYSHLNESLAKQELALAEKDRQLEDAQRRASSNDTLAIELGQSRDELRVQRNRLRAGLGTIIENHTDSHNIGPVCCECHARLSCAAPHAIGCPIGEIVAALAGTAPARSAAPEGKA